MAWHLHWLEAASDLTPWKTAIIVEMQATERHLATHVPPPRLDILIQRLPGRVIPEIGMVGHAYSRSLFGLTVDPDNERFEASLRDGTLRRQVVHEVHHCLRMGGPGYGNTLGEALVSEGLAGQFTRWLFGNPPEHWERAVDAEDLRAHAPDRAALASTDYGHNAWFFGEGGRYPRWLGYTLGYAIVGDWLDRNGFPDAGTWVDVPAEAVLDAARSNSGGLVK